MYLPYDRQSTAFCLHPIDLYHHENIPSHRLASSAAASGASPLASQDFDLDNNRIAEMVSFLVGTWLHIPFQKQGYLSAV